MDALLMCGGRGSRLGGGEKPLRPVGGQPMVDRVRGALEGSEVGTVYAVTAPSAPATAAHVDPPTIDTAGEGYVADLQAALDDDRISRPVLTAVADLPLLSARAVDDVRLAHDVGSLTVAVPVGRASALGFTVETTIRREGRELRPTGVNVVGTGPESVITTRNRGLAANVNRPRDLAMARWFAAGNSHSR